MSAEHYLMPCRYLKKILNVIYNVTNVHRLKKKNKLKSLKFKVNLKNKSYLKYM